MNKKSGWIWTRFTRDVTMTIVVISVMTLGTVAYLSTQVRRDISEQYITDAAQHSAQEFRIMQQSIQDSLTLVCEWGNSGVFSLSKPDELKKLLLPIFGREPLLSGIMIADEKGRSYFILPNGSDRKPDEANGFDPRTRPWYAPALNSDKTYWSEQYIFHTLKEVGVTAAASYSPKGKEKFVVAFDVLLPDLYQVIRQKIPSKNSDIFVFRRDELLFLPDSENQHSQFVPISSVTNSLITDAHALWGRESIFAGEVFSFLHQGKVWWCGFQPLETHQENVWMGIMVPESDILTDANQRRFLLWGLGLAVVLVITLGGVGLLYRYNRPREEAKHHLTENTAAGVKTLIAKGENRYIEFKSTLRMNLHSKKPGKEIELAWLKGVAAFLNTDGGTLLLGVTDAGEITGLERDVFENEDKCRLHFKNLIATHIGAEMSKYIRFVMIPMEGKTVGMVHCARSTEPVFLKDGNKEAFYIRNGPSSDELPVSKALKYIKHRS